MKRNVGPKSEGSKLLILRLPRAEAFGADAVSHTAMGHFSRSSASVMADMYYWPSQ